MRIRFLQGIFLMSFFLPPVLNGQDSMDMYEEGIYSCMEEKEKEIVKGLFQEIEMRLKEKYREEVSVFSAFAKAFCAKEVEEDFFKIEKDSPLDQLILKGIEKQFWSEVDVGEEDDDVEYILRAPPPVGAVDERGGEKKPEEYEVIHWDPSAAFIKCSYIFSINKKILPIFQRYKVLRVASSTVKMGALSDVFEPSDYKFKSIQYYIALDVILQKMIHLNKYKLSGQ